MARLPRRLLLLVASLVAVAVGLVWFATTETGFRVLLRPLLARQGVEVAEGRVGLGGSVEARGVSWSGGSLETLAASLEPTSLLPGRRLRLHTLVITALSADLPAADPDAEADAEESAGFTIPGFEASDATVSIAKLRQLDASGAAVWELGPAELALKDWRPGHDDGRLDARADFALPGGDPARSGAFSLSAQLQVPEVGSEPHSFIRGQLEISLSPDALVLRAEPEGSVGERIELRGPLQLSHAGAPLLEDGQLELAMDEAGTALGLKVGRAPLPALLAALGRPAPNESVAALSLGLDTQLRAEAGSERIAVERFDLEQRRPGAEPVKLSAQGTLLPGAEPELDLALQGPGAEGGEGAAQIALASGELDVKVGSLDVTELLEPWVGGEGEGGEKQPLPEAEPDASGLVARIEIGALRYRRTLIRDGKATLTQKGAGFELDVPAARVGGGELAGRFESGVAEGRRRLAWKLDFKQLDLSELSHTLAPDREGQLEGKLDLRSEVSASVPEGADPLDALEGVLHFELRDAKANGLPFQQFMASKLAVDGLASLAFTGAQGDLPIRNGRAIFEDLYLDGNAANFKVRGSLSARDVDLAVNPRLGPRLASEVGPGLTNALFETASGALALPVAFTVKGDWGATRFLMQPAPPSLVGDVLGVTTGVLSGAARLLLGGGEDAGAERESEPTPEAPPSD